MANTPIQQRATDDREGAALRPIGLAVAAVVAGLAPGGAIASDRAGPTMDLAAADALKSPEPEPDLYIGPGEPTEPFADVEDEDAREQLFEL